MLTLPLSSAENTGILTARTPTFDIDIYDPNAAQAVEELVRNHFEEKGAILGRTKLLAQARNSVQMRRAVRQDFR